MKSSFLKKDVELLLKDITGLVEPLPTKEREAKIQAGVHYSEMLPLEYKPSDKYVEIYESSLHMYAQATADAVSKVSQIIWHRKGKSVVLVSLARAGTPIGILIKRYIQEKYCIKAIPHFSVSIIRDRGIDKNAINYIMGSYKPQDIMFVDGWVGKGVIFRELQKALADYPEISPEIAVLSDPAYVTDICGTREDILIPSSCLNSTVSGLISRTFYSKKIIGDRDFHGAVFYQELLDEDRTYEFINTVQSLFDYSDLPLTLPVGESSAGMHEVMEICKDYKIDNINFVKPGVGETTRVLLRRVPWKVLIASEYAENRELEHIRQLAKEKSVPVEFRKMKNYKCCGIIKNGVSQKIG